MRVGLIVFFYLIKQLLQTLIFWDPLVRRMVGVAEVWDVLDEVMRLYGPASLPYGPAGLQRIAQEQTERRSQREEILHLELLWAAVVTQQLLQTFNRQTLHPAERERRIRKVI